MNEFLRSISLHWYNCHTIISKWNVARALKLLFCGRNWTKTLLSEITPQKLSQTDENHISMGLYGQLGYVGTIVIQ